MQTIFKTLEKQGKQILICKYCGEKIVHYGIGLYHANWHIFPQYCKNVMDENGNVIKHGHLHEPL